MIRFLLKQHSGFYFFLFRSIVGAETSNCSFFELHTGRCYHCCIVHFLCLLPMSVVPYHSIQLALVCGTKALLPWEILHPWAQIEQYWLL